jgi:hypothetical protein
MLESTDVLLHLGGGSLVDRGRAVLLDGDDLRLSGEGLLHCGLVDAAGGLLREVVRASPVITCEPVVADDLVPGALAADVSPLRRRPARVGGHPEVVEEGPLLLGGAPVRRRVAVPRRLVG